MITRVDAFEERDFAVHCVGVDDLVRGHPAVFLTPLDDIEPVDPAKTRLIKDASNGYKLSKLFLDAQLRQVPATGTEPDFDGMGVFRRMRFQEETVRRALTQLRPRLLLTTATPHNGKKETFGRLISLLDPSAIPDPRLREYSADDIKDFFLMRFKEDIRDDASGMLADRRVIPPARTTADATPAEERVYGVLAGMRQALQDEDLEARTDGKRRRHTALLQYGFYKLFLSSPDACHGAMRARLEKLDREPAGETERDLLGRLASALKRLTLSDSARYGIFKDQLRDMRWDGGPDSPRVLVFTEYRRTQDALARALAKDFKIKHSDKFEDQARQAIAVIHGSTPDIHLMGTVEAFATGSSPLRIMIATDVASEGINLHHECRHIIHYDLPWSIITLIQRNGRIDRLGQEKNPILRYLRVNTEQGLLKGDGEIFNRLIEKVEEINRLRKSGESILRLYDPEAEEAYVARRGILEGDVDVLEKPSPMDADPNGMDAGDLETLLSDATQAGRDDFMAFLMGEDGGPDPAESSPEADLRNADRLRLFPDREFLRVGYQATAIPMESWPKHDQFRLTEDPERVDLAIKAARHHSGYWSGELLCNEQHPILKWLTERLLMTVDRGEAPIIVSPHLAAGELCFCFIGQVSSKSGAPLIVAEHAVSFFKDGDGKPRTRPLKGVMDVVGFDRLTNTGAEPNILAAEPLLHAAVGASLDYMDGLKTKREKELIPLLRKEERRLKKWKDRREEILRRRMADLGEKSPQARRIKTELEEMADYLRDRQKHWRDSHFQAATHPATRLILVIQGASQGGFLE